ncbi:hypothetical protein DYB32_002582, partial [Aphanomyces invadans]
NEPTLFTTGTDEHGLKVQQAADNAGKPTSQFCDDVAVSFQAMCAHGDIRYDRFVRTTEPSHAVAVAAIWRTLVENDYIYLGEHEAYYCISDETFLTDMQVDTRENGQIVSKESGHPVELVKEQNYKFRLSKFQDKLLEWLDDHPDVVQPPSRYNEVRSCWPAAYHIVGKDILKFHAIYWPAFLMAANLPLPNKIVAHAHWTVNGVKMSKSLGNVVNPTDIINKVHSSPLSIDPYYSINRNFSKHEPWVLNKELKKMPLDSEDAIVKSQLVDTTLFLSIEAVRVSGRHCISSGWRIYGNYSCTCVVALLLLPIVPNMATGILNYLNVPPSERSFDFCRFGQSTYGPVANQKSKTKFVPFRKLE